MQAGHVRGVMEVVLRFVAPHLASGSLHDFDIGREMITQTMDEYFYMLMYASMLSLCNYV